MQTWRRTIVADKPVNFCSRNWNITCSQPFSIYIVHFWLMGLSIGIICKPTKSTMPYEFRLRKSHPSSHRRSNTITANDDLFFFIKKIGNDFINIRNNGVKLPYCRTTRKISNWMKKRLKFAPKESHKVNNFYPFIHSTCFFFFFFHQEFKQGLTQSS